MNNNRQIRRSLAISLALISALSINSIAQDNQRWFRRELGLAHSAVYDNGHSFAQYRGTGAQFQAGLDKESLQRLSQLNLGLQWTPLKVKVSDAKATTGTQLNVTFSYKYLRKIQSTQNNKFKVAVGASAFTDANARYYRALINNPFGWDVNIGLNVLGQIAHDFNFRNRSYTITYQAGIPMIAYNHAPNYLGNDPVSSNFNRGQISDLLDLGRLAVVSNKYFYLHQQLSIDKNLGNGNKLRITYRWDYSNNGYSTHLYQNLMTGITIGVLTSFSKNQ